MVYQVQSVHFDADQKLKDFIEKKISKLDQFFDKIINGDVILKLEATGHVQDKVVEIKLNLPGSVLISKETKKTFEEGVDLAIESLSRQLVKHKEKMREVH